MEEREYQQTMQKARLVGKLLALVVLLLPSAGWAQYKNASFGLDFSYILFPTLPSIYDDQHNYIDIASNRGDRLQNGFRLGGEYNFKLKHDHWWFDARIDMTLYGHASGSGDTLTANFDALAAKTIGEVLGIDGGVGIRYYFLTDYIRPYLQLGLSVEHLFSFASDASATCTDPGFCPDGDTFGNEFLPHTTFLALHASPSIEFIVVQDIALHIIIDLQRWIVFGGPGNTLLTFGAGVTFY